MYVKRLDLLNYRNYAAGAVEFSENTNVIYGSNAIGKTNILEALYFISSARSHRNCGENELIRFDNERAEISALINRGQRDNSVKINLYKNKKKQIKINNVPVDKASSMLGIFNMVMFCPENLSIIKGSPRERRKTTDMGMCRFGKKYFKALCDYSRLLDQRNRLLKDNPNSDTFEIWNERLAQIGAELTLFRKNYIDNLSANADKVHREICGQSLHLSFKSGIGINDFSSESIIKNQFLRGLEISADKDRRFGVTLSGCHRDDFKISIENTDVKAYASQGQQRTAAIAIKMAELMLIKRFTKDTPVLLLDDVLSELDDSRQDYILHKIEGCQVIITCTKKDFFKKSGNVNFIDAEKIQCSCT